MHIYKHNKNKLEIIKFYVEEDSDYDVTFGNGTEWKIVFWGERYTNIFDISIRNIKFKDNVSISRIGFYLGYLNKLFNLSTLSITKVITNAAIVANINIPIMQQNVLSLLIK